MIVSKDSTSIISPVTSATPGVSRLNKFGVHIYETEHGLFISATTVLKYSKSEEDKKKLEKWRENTNKKYGGEGAANYIFRQAGVIGTETHNLNEMYLKDILNDDILNKARLLSKAHHNNMKPAMDRISNVKGLELMLYSAKYGVAGTSDVIANFDDVISILDYKCKKSYQKKDWILDYFIQAAMYSTMWKEMYDEEINQAVIIISNEQNGALQIFVESLTPYFPLMEERIKEAFANLPNELRNFINGDRITRGKPPYKAKQIERLKVFG